MSAREHYSAFLAARDAAHRTLSKHVQAELDAYLKCGRFERGFLRVKCGPYALGPTRTFARRPSCRSVTTLKQIRPDEDCLH